MSQNKSVLRHRGALLGLTLGVVVAIVTIGAISGSGLFDTPPTVDEIEQEARDRGLEGPLNIVEPQPDTSLTPSEYGPYLLVPQGWQGPLPAVSTKAEPDEFGKPSESLDELMASPLWVTPDLPTGYQLEDASSEFVGIEVRASYRNDRGDHALWISVNKPQQRPIVIDVWTDAGAEVFSKTEIEGLPALTWVSPADGSGVIGARVFDPTTEVEYIVEIQDTRELGLDDAINIVRSLRDARSAQ